MRSLLLAALLAVAPLAANAATVDLAPLGLHATGTIATMTVDADGDDSFFYANSDLAADPLLVVDSVLIPAAPDSLVFSLSTISGDVLAGVSTAFASDAAGSEILFRVTRATGSFADIAERVLLRMATPFAIGTEGSATGVTTELVSIAPIPLPATAFLLGGTVLAGGIWSRRQRRAA